MVHPTAIQVIRKKIYLNVFPELIFFFRVSNYSNELQKWKFFESITSHSSHSRTQHGKSIKNYIHSDLTKVAQQLGTNCLMYVG